MIGYCKKEALVCLITEYIPGGNLSEALDNEEIQIELNLKIELALSLCRGMIYLHNQSVIHRDLKPANILVRKQKKFKLLFPFFFDNF